MTDNNQIMENLIKELEKLPGIGRRSAERISYHLMVNSPKNVIPLAEAIKELKKNSLHCQICFNISENNPCNICQDTRRDDRIICVVEQPKDLIKFERSGSYSGHYHVLTGCLSPLDGITEEHLTFSALINRLKKGSYQEVIIATGAHLDGEGTALYLQDLLQDFPGKITQLARGIPTGSSIEFASNAILNDALSGRQTLKKSKKGQAVTEYIILLFLLLLILGGLFKNHVNPKTLDSHFQKPIDDHIEFWKWPVP